MLIDIIAGARPNFMKIAPIINVIKLKNKIGVDINYRLIHTGQHYDQNMSGNFFEQLGIPEPDINLGAGGGTQAEQTAAIMIGYERVLLNQVPQLCIVVGDVTSTMACSITAKKMNIPIAHVEAGIRSGDWSMPEEINRITTDSITDYFFTTSSVANANLRKSGVGENQIFFVGNTMIDTLVKNRNRFKKSELWEKFKLKNGKYIVMTLHRPSNVDEEEILKSLIHEILNNSKDFPIIFPVHPRTRKILEKLGIKDKRLFLVDPLGYLEFNYLVERSKAVITDSGGITEETTFMSIPCITLRDSTERPETCTIGTNELIGTNPIAIKPVLEKLFSGNWKNGAIPELWDGETSSRIVEHIINIFDL